MNIISNQPINSIYRTNNIQNNRPAFTAKPKAPTTAQVKKGLNIVQKFYGLAFTPFGEKLKVVKDGYAYTELRLADPHVIFGKKYKLWSREPEMTVRNNVKTGIQTKAVHKGEVNDIEIKDLHTPGYEVSVGYKGVSKEFDIYTDENKNFWPGGEYNGDISIKYGDKKFTVSGRDCERIKKEFDESTSKKYNKSIGELTSMGYEKFHEFLTGYYQDPEIIGRAILSSPSSLEHQLHTIPSSLPYGIEEIEKHLI